MDALALRFRPQNIDEIVGQKSLLGVNAPLYKLIKNHKIPHSIFFGPPGTGKTTLARAIANEVNSSFYELDATSLKVESFRKIFSLHQNSLTKPLVFIDEIHRLSKTQQEVLLLPMENHEAIIIGASTENPYYALSSGIRSRMMLFEFHPLNTNDLNILLTKAKDELEFEIEDEAREYLVSSSANDSRAMFNLLEYALHVESKITLQTLKALRPQALKDGVSSEQTHYHLASAMIKSIRGSDVDASLYYLARLIDGAEPPEFIARRLVILASEDIGNANPNALNLAVSTMSAVKTIGYPESRIILAQCVVFLASCPKSNSCYEGINNALEYVRNNEKLTIPQSLQPPLNKGYKYPHAYGGWVKQAYLTKKVTFYNSRSIGYEKTLNEWLVKLKNPTNF